MTKNPSRTEGTPSIEELIASLVKRFPEEFISIEHHYNSHIHAYTYDKPTRHMAEIYVLYIDNHAGLTENGVCQYDLPSYDSLVKHVNRILEDPDNGY